MKIKKDFVLRQVAGNWVVLPLAAETVNFSGMLSLNDAGAFLWRVLEQESSVDTLVDALTSEYNVSGEQARADAEEFVEKLVQAGCVEL